MSISQNKDYQKLFIFFCYTNEINFDVLNQVSRTYYLKINHSPVSEIIWVNWMNLLCMYLSLGYL